ncbi:MAG: hypothetical protein LQ344_000847 [Seirophora lacunosa]|nr:MAG: hypothetical protein LQ344_000847 [Seirophora lacunosa]
MLDCISRCIRTIFADFLGASSHIRYRRRPRLGFHDGRYQASHHRGYHTILQTSRHLRRDTYQLRQSQVAARYQTTHAFPSTEAYSEPPPLSFSRSDEDEKTASDNSLSGERSVVEKHSPEARDPRRERQLDQELVWLRDPVKLAENTISLLRKDDHERALETVRKASKSVPCSVSWNHLIDYDMSKGKIQKAIKKFNEMKKRAQQPDAQTYTILLRGLSWQAHLPETLSRALKIYHSMSAKNCPVKPNIIHTNAMLKVCALARDMDTLWAVAAKLPRKGAGSPDNLTITIILNAIRTVAWHGDEDLQDESVDELSIRRQRAVVQGRKLWEEIIPRWRAGDFWIDEEVVCAMGRLLLLGSTRQDFEDVLSLVEQVMRIPREERKLSDRAEPAENQPAIGPGTAEAQAFGPAEAQALGPEGATAMENDQADSSDLENDESSSPLSASDATLTPALTNVFGRELSPTTSTSIPRPGRNTLSLLLDACISLRAIPSGQFYWGLLTSPMGPYDVTPDSENYHMYLRLLRVQRASSVAADLVADMHTGSLKDMGVLQPKTIRIALSCCVRDKNNAHANAHAHRILQTMFQAFAYPDPRAMEIFVQMTLWAARRDFRAGIRGLQAMDRGMTVLNRAGNYGGGADKRREVLQLTLKAVGACDEVARAAGDRLENKERKWLTERKMTWGAWIGRTRRQLSEKGERAGRPEADDGVDEDGRAKEEGSAKQVRRRSGGGDDNDDDVEEKKVAVVAAPTRRRREIIPGSMESRVGSEKRMAAARRRMRRSGEFDFYGE